MSMHDFQVGAEMRAWWVVRQLAGGKGADQSAALGPETRD